MLFVNRELVSMERVSQAFPRLIATMAMLLPLAFAGCAFDSTSLEELSCSTIDDCPLGRTCSDGFCVLRNEPVIDIEEIEEDVEEDAVPDDLCGDRVCEDEEQCCNETCVPLNSREHCAMCGNSCDLTEVCSLSAGGCVCSVGLSDCEPETPGCETSLLVSSSHCGTCGKECAALEDCADGRCLCEGVSCGEGQKCCPGDTAAGCLNINTNANNCGNCGVACGPGELCVDGACRCGDGSGCGQGSICCDGVCEMGDTCSCGGVECTAEAPLCCDDGMGNDVCLGYSDQNCGACGEACAMDRTCQGGSCECAAGTIDCNGACADLLTDDNNCGGCGLQCGMGESCCNGECSDVCDWWNNDYLYRQRIEVTAGAAVPSGYSVSITFDHEELVSLGRARPNGDDVRILRWNAGAQTWTELPRTVDFYTGWENVSTRVWFPLNANIAAAGTDNDYFLYYGYTAMGDPMAPTAGWADVYTMAATFNGQSIPSYIRTELRNGAYTRLDGDDLWLDMNVSGGSSDQAGVLGWNTPVSAPPSVNVQMEGRVDTATSSTLVRMLSIRQSNGFPTPGDSGSVNAEERVAILESTAGQIWPVYQGTDGVFRIWNDGMGAWTVVAQYFVDETPWSFPGQTDRIYEIDSDGVEARIRVRERTGAVLGETGPFPWSDVQDNGNDLWIVWGEPLTNIYRAEQLADWIQVKERVEPEPTTSLSPVVERF